jgi:hypothetical protein
MDNDIWRANYRQAEKWKQNKIELKKGDKKERKYVLIWKAECYL